MTIKKTLTAMALSVVATQSMASNSVLCAADADVYKAAAEARDRAPGWQEGAKAVGMAIVEAGSSADRAMDVVQFVFIDHKQMAPDMIGHLAYAVCMEA